MTYIEELKDVIRKLHGADATHVETVPVKETFEGKTVWEGDIEVFELHGHSTATRLYAWSHDTGDPRMPKRHLTVLHLGPVTSAITALRAVLIQEFRNAETEES